MTKSITEEIARQAYYLWEKEGRPDGKDFVHWLEAEAQLSKEVKPVKKAAKPKAKRVPAKRKSR